ncbi:PLP-dependent cysteine synthase family protein [Huintestinicola sp.]|uniref:PLP-dependent cysteine synthase family protein n=1 Tax=Huintestinicola sp. TaxID=2981661 RepID=UPI003D7CA7A3
MNTDKFSGIEGLIGKTPLLEIRYTYKDRPGRIFAKAEYLNMTGSIKDRVAFHILKRAYENDAISPTDVICEATSGNTGIAFSAIGSYLGHKVIIYMPDWMSAERINLMKSFGAEVRLVSREQGGFLGSIALTEELAKQGNVFLPCQFSNEDNTEAHMIYTGEEISRQLAALGLKADGVVAGVGTGGTVMGIGKRLKEDNPECKIYPLEPLNSPTLSTGYKVGKHRIQGISDEFIPPILKLEETDKVISVDDIDSIIMAQTLSRRFGIGVGISSGANMLGCILAREQLGADSTVVTVFADDNKKYLSTDYSEEHAVKDNYLTRDILLTDVIAHKYE